MSTYYKVTLKIPEKSDTMLEVDGDTYIMDAAVIAGIELPRDCGSGACSLCTGKLLQGTVNQSDQSFLTEKQIDAGFVLLCVAYPTSDCVIKTGEEDALIEATGSLELY